MPARRKPVPPFATRDGVKPGPLARLLTPVDVPAETAETTARERALAMLRSRPTWVLSTKAVLDDYLDAIGVGR